MSDEASAEVNAKAPGPRDPTRRFASRVAHYVRWRPGYPQEIVGLLERECRLGPASVVADIGSGTGLLSRLLLDHGNPLFGVEPNTEMREAGAALLADCPRFTSVAASAEATTLAAASIDLIVAGQAFHWFERVAARGEFARILRPGGFVALIWNERLVDVSPFLREYEQLLCDYSLDYRAVDHRNVDEAVLGAFFAPAGFRQASFPFRQVFDLDGLRGRTMSASYTPEPGHPRFEPMIDALTACFVRHADGGTVDFDYATRVFYGRLE